MGGAADLRYEGGVVFLALSCLQGRPMRWAFDELRAPGLGIQLTPGNEPSKGFEAHVARSGVPVRTHHGFSYAFRQSRVWADDGALLARSHSVHPPKSDTPAASGFDAWLERADASIVLETMYPGYRLGTGAELERAMTLDRPLAVDVSHLFIQRTAGVLGDATLRRLFDYSNVVELHVSQNDGRHDSHRLLRPDAFGLEWALERARTGVPLIHEAYLHRASAAARKAQLELLGVA